MNYKNEYIQSILSYIDYVTLNGINGKIPLINKDLSDPINNIQFNTQIKEYINDDKIYNELKSSLDFFTEHFEIIKQDESVNGFSATTYKLKTAIEGSTYQEGELFVSYRGTQPSDVGDLLTDFKLTFTDQLSIPFISQEYDAYQYLKETIDNNANVTINISGHSLGGYLAARSYYKLSEDDYARIGTVTTFNGAGFSAFDGPFITSTKRELYVQKISNIFSYRGLNVTSGNLTEIGDFDVSKFQGTVLSTFQHLGPRIASFTENPGGFTGNHSMAMHVTSMGFFSILQNMIVNLSTVGTDLTIDDAIVKSIDNMLMGAVPDNKDFGLAYNALASNLLKIFDITRDTINYPSAVAQFLSLDTYFRDNQQFKIELLDTIANNSQNILMIDSNSNRSLIYSLLNNLTFKAIVPENYNSGIYKKDEENTANRIYNIEYYLKEHIDFRVIYNQIYTAVMQQKILDDLPSAFTDATISLSGFNKFAFIDQINVIGNSNGYNIIYVNTNKQEYQNSEVQLIYFKTSISQTLKIYLDNALIFDTPGNDNFNIFSSNNIIHSTYGSDIIYISSGTGNVLLIDELSATSETQYLSIVNNVSNEHSFIIKNDYIYLNDVIVKSSNISENTINTTISIDFGNKYISLSGSADLVTSDTSKDYSTILSMVTLFSELFTNSIGHNLVFDNQFIDDYIKVTSNQFDLILDGIDSINVFSQAHSNYVVAKINEYSTALNGIDFSNFVSYVENKVTDYQLDTTGLQQNILDRVIPLINDKITEQSVLVLITNKLNAFKTTNYANQVDMSTTDNNADGYINNIYGKKETKNYNKVDNKWIWDGNYYYNRSENGVQIGAFYNGDTSKGELLNYYNDNIYISNQTSSSIITGSISGSDGSDILIGTTVIGQSDYKGISGNTVVTAAGQNQNGNDILIGTSAEAFSGDNFIYGSLTAKGGSGSDLLISNQLIYTNYQYNNDQETIAIKNEAILLGTGKVFSSNGKNTIINLSETTNNSSRPVSIIYATGNDTYIGGKNSSLFIGGYTAFNLLQENQSFFGQLTDFWLKVGSLSSVESFYSNYQNYSGKNYIYAGEGVVRAALGLNDYINLSKGSGEVMGAGYNEIILSSASSVLSGGHSSITINGDYNNIYLGDDDNYSMSNSNNNKIYSYSYQSGIDAGQEHHDISGSNNFLYVGNASQDIILKGNATTVNFVDNNNDNKLSIRETGNTTLNLGNQERLDIVANNYVYLLNGVVIDINLLTSYTVNINNLKSTNFYLAKQNDFSNNNFVILNSAIEIENLTIQSDSITGSVSNVAIAILEGFLTQFQLTAQDSGADVTVNGFIDGYQNSFTNINNFTFNQISNINNKAYFQINDSDIVNYISNGSTSVTFNNSNIENLELTGINHYVSTNGYIHNAAIDVSGSLTLSGNNIASLDINYQYKQLHLVGSNLDTAIFSGSSYYMSFTASNGSDIIIKSSLYEQFSLNLENINGLSINGGYYVANFINVTDITIDIDAIDRNSSFIGSENITVVASGSITATFKNNKYLINGIKFDEIPESIKIQNKHYSYNELNEMFNVLKQATNYTASAQLLVTGISFNDLGEVDMGNGIVYDGNGNYVGTDNNDVIYATDHRSYHINSGKGNDYIDFGTPTNNSFLQVIEYSRGDGTDSINSNGDNIQVQLNDINSNELTFQLVSDSIKNDKILNVLLDNTVILSISGYLVSNIEFIAMDRTINKPDLNHYFWSIYGTDSGETIIGLEDSDTYVYAGKGDDIINFTSGFKNIVYYSKDDGVETINSINDFEVNFSQDINKAALTYKKLTNTSFELYLDGEKILIINNSDKAQFNFYNGDILTGTHILDNSSLLPQTEIPTVPYFDENGTYMGTDLDDNYILDSNSIYHLQGNKGNDTYNFDPYNDKNNLLDYYEGDGYDKIYGISKKLDINLNDMNSIDLEFVKNTTYTDALDLYYKNNLIMTINEIHSSNILIQLADIGYNQSDLNRFVESIYGTNNEDVISNTYGTDNYIYAGKGDDIIILDGPSDGQQINNIYYYYGDGNDTIAAMSLMPYQIIIDENINPEDVTYTLIMTYDSIGLTIKHENQTILTLPYILENDFSLKFMADNTQISSLNLAMQTLMLNGTSGDDVLNTTQVAAMIDAGNGNDVINLNAGLVQSVIDTGNGDDIINVNSTDGLAMITKSINSGYDKIVLMNQTNQLMIDMSDMNESSIMFQYNTDNHNNLDVYYKNSYDTYDKILTINNYILNDNISNNIDISLGDTSLSSSDINQRAESNYQLVKQAESININSMIDFMASDTSGEDDFSGSSEMASIYIKKTN